MPTTTANYRKRDGRRIPAAKVDAIIERRWAGRTEQVIAAELGVTEKTIRSYWHAHLDEIAADRSEALERRRAEIVGRLWQNANECRRLLDEADNPALLLGAELKALVALAKAHGLYQLTATAQGSCHRCRLPTPEEAEEALRKLHRIPSFRD